MVKVTFETNGREVSPNNFADAAMAAVLENLKEDIRQRLDGIRDPETGEFPVVAIRGDSFDNLSLKISGSDALIERVQDQLGDMFGEELEEGEEMDDKPGPIAFFCHASDDKDLARRLASDLQANGIDTFFDEWEIGPGDSVRQKIDAGLERCTHFIVLLTPRSLTKPWVNLEIDSGFMQKVEGECKLIPLRSELSAEQLPPLLRTLNSPAIEDYEKNVQSLINAIHGVSNKPPLGQPPKSIREQVDTNTGLSAGAEAIARLMIQRSEHADDFDPELEPGDIQQATDLSEEDIIDAVDELEGRGLISRYEALNMGSVGFVFISPKGAIFADFDRHFMDWDPEEDAVKIAAELQNGAIDGCLKNIGEAYGWAPRRLNAAVHYLLERDLVDGSRECGSHPWCVHDVRKTAKTRRFVRDRS